MWTPLLLARDSSLRVVLLTLTCVLAAVSVAAQSAFNCVGCVHVSLHADDLGGLPSLFLSVSGSVYTTYKDVIAHPDDDIIFQSPTLISEIHSHLCITTVILTAGDAGHGSSLALPREEGNCAAYAQMAGVNNSYTSSYATFGGQPVLVKTLDEAPHIQKVLFRLPDGVADGSGFPSNGYQSLRRLYFNQINSMDSIDGQSTFTLSDLRNALSQILTARNPEHVRTLDYLSDYDNGDHSDHLTTARITASLVGMGNLAGYMGYPAGGYPATLSAGSLELQNKLAAWFAYTPYDFGVCQSLHECEGRMEYVWLEREYIVTPELATHSSNGAAKTPVSLPSGHNIALHANVTASSQSSSDQAASKVNDNSIGGLPGNHSVEWATADEGVGAWITLTWDAPVVVQDVVLYDRPNPEDWLQTGYLTFDDDSTVNITIAVNDGTASIVPLTQTYITQSITLNVTGVSHTTKAVGLAEFQVFGSMCVSCTVPSATLASDLAPSFISTDMLSRRAGAASYVLLIIGFLGFILNRRNRKNNILMVISIEIILMGFTLLVLLSFHELQ